MGRLTPKDWENQSNEIWLKLGYIQMSDEPFRTFLSESLQKLAHYEDLEEAGRLIELPCAVGDEYWCTERDDGGEGPVIHKVHSEPFACLVKDLWGIKCFATKEEAERKRRELNTHERE